MEENRKPKIRFPDFDDDWEKRKLDDILTERHILSKISDEYPRLSFTIEEGVIDPENRKTNKRDFLMKDEANKKFLLTEVGDIIYNPANVVFGAIHRNSYGKGCLSPIYRIFETNQESRFLECVVRSETFISKLAQKTEGSVVKLKTLKPEAFLEMSVSVSSSLDEQTKIADFFDKLDNLITLHQSKYETLKILKNAMLQKMFPKNGSNVPEIRFPGFTDNWEQRKLGECLLEITYGFTNPMSDTENGPWKITAKDIVDGKIDYSSARHTSQREYESLTDKSKPLIGDLLLTKDGTLGRTSIVNAENICINQSVALLRFNEKCSAQYVKTLLDTPMYQKQMLDDAGGGTIKHIYITKVDKMFIPIPSKMEQVQLVGFFANLDNLITLHQRKCEEIKEYKKGLLQQMFV